jgi:hypothetical protein
MYICTLPLGASDINTAKVEEIIRGILPDIEPNFRFRWAVVSLERINSSAGLKSDVENLLGASGGGNG